MASTSLSRLKERYGKSMARRAASVREAARAREHTLGAGATGWVLGYGERKGWDFPTVGGMDPKLLYAGVALVGANMVRNSRVRRFAGSVADGLVAVYLYDAGKTGDFGLTEGADEEAAL